MPTKKKQEFNFADIKIEKMDCYNFKKQFSIDRGSTINIKNLWVLEQKINLYYQKKKYLSSSNG